ncbi:hypothetical protein BKA65DRAFT_395257 [Rhexocercosporidium sp. MPI-PUGE-AT-0058]|nr:hypothetical protein BKA65DRAFT_395257 [Rhexocercosporidium sp. MPI-PUGE-AT-0058]
MPRKLPWLVATSSTTTRPKRAASTPVTKRQKVQKHSSDSEGEVSVSSSKFPRNQGRPPSSSPPPDPPAESFMEEGKDNDDKYRMVEDEFLSVAQQFTVHLHAAEYKRQQKTVKSENAETINTISRPVTGKMPYQTKRKLEAAALAKRQRTIIEGFGGKKENSANSDDSDIEELPYVGTTLHGLMDSPRKKSASLAKLGSMATTRAAAGFKKAAIRSSITQHKSLIDSPEPKHTAQQAQSDLIMDSTDGDDDLDAPIPAPKLVALDRKSVMPLSLHSKPSKPIAVKDELFNSFSAPTAKPLIKAELQSRITSTLTDDSTEAAPKISRLERIRLARAKKEREQQIKKEEDYNTIPNF